MTDPKGIPFACWPVTWQAIWQRITKPVGVFDESESLHGLLPVTLRELCAVCCYYLRHLERSGFPLEALPPKEAVTPAHLRGWVESNLELAPSSQAVYAARLLRVLKTAFPDHDLSPLAAASRNLNRRAQMTPSAVLAKNLPCASTLLSLGRRLILEADESCPCHSVTSAEIWRDGFMIVFLAYHPVRARTFSELEIGRTLRKLRASWRVDVPGTREKTGKPLAFDLDPEVDALLNRYLEDIRPLFPEPEQYLQRLWRTRRGTVLTGKGIGRRIGDVTEAHLDQRCTPHDFRRAAATTIVVTEAVDPAIASGLLGHADPRVTRRHYILAGSLESSKRHGRLISELMQEPRRPRHRDGNKE